MDEKLRIEKCSPKECTLLCACVRVCIFFFIRFSRASVRGYIDERIAGLQSVTVNEPLAHDIISLLTCAALHMCLPWKIQADG